MSDPAKAVYIIKTTGEWNPPSWPELKAILDPHGIEVVAAKVILETDADEVEAGLRCPDCLMWIGE